MLSEVSRKSKLKELFHGPAIRRADITGPVFCNRPASSSACKLYGTIAAFRNCSYISRFPGCDLADITSNIRVKSTQGFTGFANRSRAGIDIPRVIECPFGFTGRTGIKKRLWQIFIFGEEFSNGIGRLIELMYMRIFFGKLINPLV